MVGDPRVTTTVSSGSLMVSLMTVTVTDAVVARGAKVSGEAVTV